MPSKFCGYLTSKQSSGTNFQSVSGVTVCSVTHCLYGDSNLSVTCRFWFCVPLKLGVWRKKNFREIFRDRNVSRTVSEVWVLCQENLGFNLWIELKLELKLHNPPGVFFLVDASRSARLDLLVSICSSRSSRTTSWSIPFFFFLIEELFFS
jgi:hypothetical protein